MGGDTRNQKLTGLHGAPGTSWHLGGGCNSAELQPRELKSGSLLAEVTAQGTRAALAHRDKSRFVKGPGTVRLAPPCGSLRKSGGKG